MEKVGNGVKESRGRTSLKMFHLIYLLSITCVVLSLAVIFLVSPRPIESIVEKRALTAMPHYSFKKVLTGEYMAVMSQWFSDSSPFRDDYAEAYGKIRGAIRLRPQSDDAVSIISTPSAGDAQQSGEEEPMRKVQRGILLVGSGANLRAMMTYAGVGGGDQYAAAVNRYAKALPRVSVYSMIVPSATDFYIPSRAAQATKPQSTTIDNVHDKLSPAVNDINIYKLLKAHSKENIYLRTDHHWAPLGAYYAASAFANRAEVAFPDIKSGAYTRHTIHGFVGSMHHYSGDEAVKKAPEDFVYWTPEQIEYTTSFKQYKVDKDENITGQTGPYQAKYFKTFKDGSGQAYSTFMGSDRLLTVVKTAAGTPRRLLIIKDSFGNAVPGYLFYSFSEIHVADFRYFPENVIRYCAKNGITDLLFIFNVFNVYNPDTATALNRFLVQ